MFSSRCFLIVGCGDIGKRVVSLIRSAGFPISAICRSADNCEELHKLGINVSRADLDAPETLINMPTLNTTVFYLAPPPGGGIIDSRVRNFCKSIPTGSEPSKIVYLSTSGVYGDCKGETVTEETPPNPQTARARRRFDAETEFTNWGREREVPVVILRATGIYGPGRLPVMHLTNGSPILNEDEAPITNRIHADDLARVCVAAGEKGLDGDILNVSDGEHTTMTRYFIEAADLLGIPRPRQVSREEAAAVMLPLLYSFFTESRRIDNRKMLTKLGITLNYPTLATGLPTCIIK